MENELCGICGKIIGKLEKAFVYHDRIVCKKCWSMLTSEPGSSMADNNKKNVVSPAFQKTEGKKISLFTVVVSVVVVAACVIAFFATIDRYQDSDLAFAFLVGSIIAAPMFLGELAAELIKWLRK
jgi:hypothetical protein